MKRRDFLKWSVGGMATVVVGGRLPWLRAGNAYAAETHTIEIWITDLIKEMATHNAVNTAECYFWTYQMAVDGGARIPLEAPAPTIVATVGDTINLIVHNDLDEPHALYIPGLRANEAPLFDSGVIPAGETRGGSFTPAHTGAVLYYDHLNAPVNRVMGLHGALVVLPVPVGNDFAGANKPTPYDDPTPNVQRLYNDFGSGPHFPGLAWHQGDDRPWIWDPARGGNPANAGYRPAVAGDPAEKIVPNVTPYRTYVWITHQASPKLFKKVGELGAGEVWDREDFLRRFLKSAFSPTRQNDNPEFFTINGQSGFFGHFSPTITPMGRVGEPVVVHILNAGLWTHAMHLHANHFYVTFKNGAVQHNPLWLDTFNVEPMDRVDYTIPFMRPPSIPNLRGIGFPDEPRECADLSGYTWPPMEEFDMYFPGPGDDVAKRPDGSDVDLKQRQSPLCYPMHDHSEPSQTAQGGNYNMGLISGIYFTGDRNGLMDFPMDEDFEMMFRNIRGIASTGPAPGVEPDMTGHGHGG